jgi:hypothetical protein
LLSWVHLWFVGGDCVAQLGSPLVCWWGLCCSAGFTIGLLVGTVLLSWVHHWFVGGDCVADFCVVFFTLFVNVL